MDTTPTLPQTTYQPNKSQSPNSYIIQTTNIDITTWICHNKQLTVWKITPIQNDIPNQLHSKQLKLLAATSTATAIEMEFGGLTLRETTFSAIDRRCGQGYGVIGALATDRRFVVVEKEDDRNTRNFEARRGAPVGAPIELVCTDCRRWVPGSSTCS